MEDKTREEKVNELRQQWAEEVYRRKLGEYDRLYDRRSGFLERNDRRLKEIREREDEMLQAHRERIDARIEKRREEIESICIRRGQVAEERFERAKERTDERIEKIRSRQDKRIRRHRQKIKKKRTEHQRKVENLYLEAELRELNRMKKRKADKKNKRFKRNLKIFLGCAVAATVCFFIMETVIPGSYLKKEEIIDDTPIEEILVLDGGILPVKQYDTLTGITEEKLLWDKLMEHFNGNRAAVLGVMCNLYCESAFDASNLEDYNNELWNVTDDEYTEFVNRKTIDKKDFLESRSIGVTNGYYNKDNLWVNLDGGYGYAQFTAYDKKEGLYQYAEQWFGPGGEGEQYKFNIGDPRMQASYIIRILESNDYREMNDLIAHAANTVDACYYWLGMYEEPYDPYCDNYYTLAFERASAANEIEAVCDPVL